MPLNRLRAFSRGWPTPFGARERGGGINFALFSRHATKVCLLLFDAAQDDRPRECLALDPRQNRTGDIWHIGVGGIGRGSLYAWQVDGPYAPEQGHRFNPHKILLDPYAAALAGTDCWDFSCACGYITDDIAEDLSFSTEGDAGKKAKCLVPETDFDWGADRPLKHPWSETVIYECHVRGLTIDPASGVKHPGTFIGLIDKIPYLQSLGISAIELLPVQEFFEKELIRRNPLNGERLRNYWGYSTVAFFAPKESYSTRAAPGAQVTEFKTMVRALHKAGIEVILDIVFNHTAEGDQSGPTLNFRGLDNRIYYLLETDRRYYLNYSGTGNTLNCNHPVVRDYILDCLRHWVVEMHVDGFRFDLASVLGRDETGELLPNPPLLERIAEDPILRDVKLIAEAWDAGGAYQVGRFPGLRWSEWNSRFRDDVRRFWRGDPGMTGALATRLCGSADLYAQSGKAPVNSINYLTCHDGFTLNDLVSYAEKHNLTNGHENRDGAAENYSDNHGVEGPSEDPAVAALRLRQMKNMMATLFLSRGIPMVLGGDEFGRTQQGNNNAYCQDNKISWFDWRLLNKNQELFRFVQRMIRLRRRHPALRVERFYTPDEIQWFGPDLGLPDWDGPYGVLGCKIALDAKKGEALLVLFNARDRDLVFRLPQPPERYCWLCDFDTAQSPRAHGSVGALRLTGDRSYTVAARSLALFNATAADDS